LQLEGREEEEREEKEMSSKGAGEEAAHKCSESGGKKLLSLTFSRDTPNPSNGPE
jgi:hypothetical protein